MGKDHKLALTDKDNQYVDKLLTPQYGDVIHFKGFVEVATQPIDKKKKISYSKRILVLCRHRFYVVERGFFGYSTEHNCHYFDIKSMSTERDDLCVAFPDKLIWIKSFSGTISGLIRIIRESYAKITIGWGSNSMNIEIPNSQLDPIEEIDPSLGLSETYIAQCAYFKTQISQEFIHFCDYLKTSGTKAINLNNCPGTQDGICDNSSLLISLQYNTFFKSLSAEFIPLTRGGKSLGSLIQSNITLTNISLIRLQGKIDWSQFGNALAQNPNNAIHSINLSENEMAQKDIEAFCKGIKEKKTALIYLNLSRCDLNSKSIATLFDGLRSNWPVSLSIQELHLAHNKFEELGSTACAEFLNAAKNYSRLAHLNIAGTSPNVLSILQHIRHLQSLTFLDISEIKLDKNSLPEVISALNLSEKISSLAIRGAKLSPDIGENVIAAFMRETERKNEPSLDISFNDLPAERVLKSVCVSSTNLTRINIEGNKFKGTGMSNFLSNLAGKASQLRELIIGQNDLSPSDGPNICKSLQALLESSNNLSRLSFKRSGLAEGLKPFFELLRNNASLKWLDISHNKLRNTFLDFVEALRFNTSLEGIGIDENKISYGGFQSLKYALLGNSTIKYLLEYPSKDVTLLKGSLKSKLLLNNLNDMLFEIEYKLKQNRQGGQVPVHEVDPYFEMEADPNRVWDTIITPTSVPEHLTNYVVTPSVPTRAKTLTRGTELSTPSPTLSSLTANDLNATTSSTESGGTEMRVKFDYDATDKNEISIQKGQTVILLENGTDGWSKGKVKGSSLVGFFPTEYVEEVGATHTAPPPAPPSAETSLPPPEPTPEAPPLPTPSDMPTPPPRVTPPPSSAIYVVAIADYTGQSDSELSFQTGDRIEFLEDADQGWCKGNLNGQVGYYPSGFCERQ